MTVLFRDVHDGLDLDRQTVEGLSFTELLYADDTALITTTAPAMNKLVAKIDTCAEYFGLKFNYNKCVAMNYNTAAHTKFKNNERIPTDEETQYLGAGIRRDHNVRREISRKICSCFPTLKKLDLFWKNHNCPRKFRLQVFDAVIRSKLVYGLESIMITKPQLNRLDTLQLKGLRKILGFNTTFVERANTNKRVFEKANTYKNTRNLEGKNIKPFSEYVRQKQHQLLAHTIRSSNDDPLREATLMPDSGVPVHVGKRRVGRPRDNWTWSAYEELYMRNNLGTRNMFKQDMSTGATRVAAKAYNRSIIC